MNAIRNIRGCNYLPFARTSHNLSLSMLPVHGKPTSGFPTVGADGFFDIVHLRTELDQLKRAGFNSIRLWGSYMSWYCDQAGYLACLYTLCQELHARRMGMTYLMWNAISEGIAATGSLLSGAYTLTTGAAGAASGVLSGLWSLAEAWQTNTTLVVPFLPPNERYTSHWAEPMTADEWDTVGAYATWPTAFKNSVNAYITTIGRFFAQDMPATVLDSFDLYNEPDSSYGSYPALKAMILAFAKVTHDLLRAQLPNPIQCSVGYAGIGHMTETLAAGIPLTYYSIHNYGKTTMASVLATALAETPQLKQMVVCEFYDTRVDFDGDLRLYMDAMDTAGASGYMWCYMQNNHYPTLDGIVKADTPSKLIKLGTPYGHVCVRPQDDARIRRWTGATT